MSERFTLVIAGGGPAGLAAGVQAARRGVPHVVFERGELANTIHRYQKGKHVMAEPGVLPLQSELALGFEAGTREAVLSTWADGVSRAGVNIQRGPGCEVVKIEGAKGAFTVTLRDGRAIGAERVVLAIGVQGNLRRFNVPGDDLPHVTYQLDDPMEHEKERIVVVGVGDAAIENALALAASGNQVTVVNRKDDIPLAKDANREALLAAVKSGAVTYFINTSVHHFEPGVAVFDTEQGQLLLECELVIGRLGADPPRGFLEAAGIALPSKDRTAVPHVSESYESNVTGLHVIGALAGYPLIKNCMNQGFEVVEHALGQPVLPADQPLLDAKLRTVPGSVAEIMARIRERIPLFRGLSQVQLREFLLGSEVRVQKPGDVVFQRNDFSDSFFTILEGAVEVLLPATDLDADVDAGRRPRQEKRLRVEAGGFFGEGSLISGRRRTGTVRAVEPCVLIESSRFTVLQLMKRVPDVRRALDEAFLARRLSDFFSDATPEELRALAAAGEFRRYDAGAELFKEGDEPDGLHYLRRGSVVVSRSSGGRDVVVNYVQAGHTVGDRALTRPDGRRTATVRAAVATETVRLPADVIRRYLADHAGLRERLETEDLRLAESDAARLMDRPGTSLVGFLMAKGAGEATDLLVIDESLCIRCDNCEKACADTHGGVSRLDRETGPTFDTIHLPNACQHCENPKCMTECPPDVIRRKPDGEVYMIDGCIGCGACARNCPYGVIQMADKAKIATYAKRRPGLLWQLLFGSRVEKPGAHAEEKIAVKCDLCTNLTPRRRGETRAACVASCPTGAIVRVNPRTYVDELLGRQDA